MIIDANIKKLVARIETTSEPTQLDVPIRELVGRLRMACGKPEHAARYRDYAECGGVVEPYPLDTDGYAASFDPLESEKEFYACWQRYGIVVGKQVISPSACRVAIRRMHALMRDVSNGACSFDRPETYAKVPADASGIPILSRGFFEIYHDDMLAQLRQAVRMYVHHVLLWGRADLWTSFDRLGVKLPGHEESYGLPLHVDQNPLAHPGFQTVQGVLALTDCPISRGTYAAVPGSKKYFFEYAHMAGSTGEHVELDPTDPVAAMLQKNLQPLPLRAGDIVSWDSRTTHANTENSSQDVRMVAYIAQGPAHEECALAVAARAEAFRTGLGSNVREALMHASKPPRYTDPEAIGRVRKPERLTLLGTLLYGQASYKKI